MTILIGIIETPRPMIKPKGMAMYWMIFTGTPKNPRKRASKNPINALKGIVIIMAIMFRQRRAHQIVIILFDLMSIFMLILENICNGLYCKSIFNF